DDGDATFTSWRSEHFIDTSVRNIQFRPITARVESVRPKTSLDEPDFAEPVAVDEEHTIGLHVSHKKDLAVGRDPDVLGHAALRKLEVVDDLMLYEINLRQFAFELASKDREATIDGKVGVIDPTAARHFK